MPKTQYPQSPLKDGQKEGSKEVGELTMKNHEAVHYDEFADVLCILSKEGTEEEFIEISPGINVEQDKDGNVIGVEMLNASELLGSVAEPLRKKSTQD